MQKRENIRKSEISGIWKRGAGGGVESLDLNGKMLEMKISTDMEMGTCLIRIEENWSAALRARLLVSWSAFRSVGQIFGQLIGYDICLGMLLHQLLD